MELAEAAAAANDENPKSSDVHLLGHKAKLNNRECSAKWKLFTGLAMNGAFSKCHSEFFLNFNRIPHEPTRHISNLI